MDELHAAYTTKRVNHSVQFVDDDGTSTNQAESYFARLRRAEWGQHHHMGRHLDQYAGEMAWREDHRRTPNGSHWLIVISAAAAHPVSRRWAGYWQRSAA